MDKEEGRVTMVVLLQSEVTRHRIGSKLTFCLVISSRRVTKTLFQSILLRACFLLFYFNEAHNFLHTQPSDY